MARPGFRKPHVSMRGQVIDMEALRSAGENTVAIGNAKMNGRGDILGKRGQIEVRREELSRQYAEDNHQKAVSLKPALPDAFESPSEAMARLTQQVSNAEVDQPQGITKKPRKLIDKDE